RPRQQPLELRATFVKRSIPQVLAADGERVEGDERRRRVLGEPGHPRRGRVEPQLQGVEVQSARRGDDDLAVQYCTGGEPGEQRVVQLRKIPIQRSQVAALDEDVRGPAEDNRAESVPLRLVQERIPGRELGRDL